jgi:hypothetical protein
MPIIRCIEGQTAEAQRRGEASAATQPESESQTILLAPGDVK